jgi:electron transfer flavoprotein alpha subunit
VAQAAAQVAGVAKVLHADSPALAEQLAENVAAQVLAIASGYSHIFFPATAHGKNVAPRVAAKLDVGQLSDISKVISGRHLRAPDLRRQRDRHGAVHAGAEGRHRAHHRASIRPPPPGGSAAVESVAAVADSGKSAFVGKEIAKSDRPELTAAKIIVSGGRAMGSNEKFMEVLTPLADKLGAALGASRAAVDAGYAPNDWQVGQTGKIVAPQLYSRVRHLGRDPAPGRHEGLEGHRRDQQGRGGADLQRRRLRPGRRPLRRGARAGQGALSRSPSSTLIRKTGASYSGALFLQVIRRRP